MGFRMKDYGFVTDEQGYFNGKNCKEYSVWLNMVNRCYNETDPRYKTYGGRGVYVCEEWKLYSNFKKWYGENNPTHELTMDKDLSGGMLYSPSTVKFITRVDNIRESNTRNMPSMIEKKTRCIESYKSISTKRSHFKLKCKKSGWDFDEFEEIDSNEISGHNKKYYYIYKGEI